MTFHAAPTLAEIHRIEIKARRLRAEALREMFAALGRTVAGLFAQKGTRRTA